MVLENGKNHLRKIFENFFSFGQFWGTLMRHTVAFVHIFNDIRNIRAIQFIFVALGPNDSYAFLENLQIGFNLTHIFWFA